MRFWPTLHSSRNSSTPPRYPYTALWGAALFATLFNVHAPLLRASPGIDKTAGDELQAAIVRLIGELDDDAYQTRRRAELELIRIGPACLASVTRATKSPSAEVRSRARRILVLVRHNLLCDGFLALASEEDDAQIDLEQGMLLITQFVDPEAQPDELQRELDRLADGVRKALGPHVDPAQCKPEQAMHALLATLFGPQGLRGNAANYYDPRNNSLKYVLEHQGGMPIMLSQVAIAVGERLKLPLVGLPMPYRYMFKYDGSRAPEGFSKSDIIVDAFDGGKIVTVDDLEDIIARLGGGFDPLRHLQPGSRRETLTRMLRNLQSGFARSGSQLEYWQTGEYLRLIEGPFRSRPTKP